MKGLRPFLILGASALAFVTLAAAQRPAALAVTSGGLWELSGAPGGKAPQRMCVADTSVLAQYEHRNQICTRIVISDTPTTAVIHYTCAGGGFGPVIRNRRGLVARRGGICSHAASGGEFTGLTRGGHGFVAAVHDGAG